MSARNTGPKSRTNGGIRAKTVRLIGADGEMLGVVSIKEALSLASAAGLDLIEIAPNAEPPVCKILSYSKWKYENDLKLRERRRNQVETKEMKFNVRIGDGDVAIKCRKINEMLQDGDHVKIVVQMRGRERSHPELAQALLDRILTQTTEAGKLEGKVSKDQARLSVQLIPKR